MHGTSAKHLERIPSESHVKNRVETYSMEASDPPDDQVIEENDASRISSILLSIASVVKSAPKPALRVIAGSFRGRMADNEAHTGAMTRE